MARSFLANRENTLFFSIAGYWEVGIKTNIGRLELSSDWQDTIPREMTRNGVSWLEITPDHVHNDLPIVTADPAAAWLMPLRSMGSVYTISLAKVSEKVRSPKSRPGSSATYAPNTQPSTVSTVLIPRQGAVKPSMV